MPGVGLAIKSQIMGREIVVAVTKDCLDIGSWEQIFYGEFMASGAKEYW